MAREVAVLLSNYGGPSCAAECEPYLRNIFSDPDLIPIPGLLRPVLAPWIAKRRAPKLQGIYAAMGRYSPILEQTRAQAEALERALGEGFRCYSAMRYFSPTFDEVAKEIIAAGHRTVVHLPLYPQESSTTTGSSVKEAHRAFREARFAGELLDIRSFCNQPGYLDALVELTAVGLERAGAGSLLLFSAHGLPLSVAKRDRYPGEVRATCEAVCERLARKLVLTDSPAQVAAGEAGLAWQSKVGPMKWLEPSFESVLEAAHAAGRPHVVVVPVAFVSEHSETLYELDLLFGGQAREMGLGFTRVPTLQSHPRFISALAEAVSASLKGLPTRA